MAVAVQLDFAGGTVDQYDEVIRRMGFQPGGPGAKGGLFHWAAQTDDGLRVTDVWESREQFEEFAQNQIGPITQQVGVPSQPQITVFEVHNYLTAG